MAWQTPKTNWGAADGVRDTDMNRIEENILELYNTESAKAARTIYVSPSGNDTTGTGASSAPYRTITKALSTLPKNLNGQQTLINLAAGSYPETVNIRDFFGGTLTINGNAGAVVNINGLDIRNCSVLLSAIALVVGTGGIYIGGPAVVYAASGSITVNGAAEGVTLRYGAILEVTTTLTINNTTSRGLQVQYASTASVATLTGTGNSIGVYVYHSTVFIRNQTIGAVTQTINENSAIYVGGAVG